MGKSFSSIFLKDVKDVYGEYNVLAERLPKDIFEIILQYVNILPKIVKKCSFNINHDRYRNNFEIELQFNVIDNKYFFLYGLISKIYGNGCGDKCEWGDFDYYIKSIVILFKKEQEKLYRISDYFYNSNNFNRNIFWSNTRCLIFSSYKYIEDTIKKNRRNYKLSDKNILFENSKPFNNYIMKIKKIKYLYNIGRHEYKIIRGDLNFKNNKLKDITIYYDKYK
jgi:hypothetical protein